MSPYADAIWNQRPSPIACPAQRTNGATGSRILVD